jgi:hypothetical protein
VASIDDALALAIASADRVTEAEYHFTTGYYAAHDGHLHESAQHHLAAAVALLHGARSVQR